MSEEEKVEEQPVEAQAEQSEQTEQPAEEASDNVIFNALYAAAEEDGEEEEEPREPYTGPTSIHSALSEEHVEEVAEQPQQSQEPVAEEEAPKPKSKAKVKRKIIDPQFDAPVRQQAPVRKPVAVDPFVKTLLPEEQEAYQISRWAAQNVQGQENLDKKYLDFFKKHKQFLDDHSDYDLSDSEEYKKFLDQNKPKVNLKKFEREMWTADAEQRAIKKMQPEIMKLRRNQDKIQGEPVAKQSIHNAKKILFESIPDDTRNIIQESGIKGLVEQNPIEAKIVNDTLTNAQEMVNTFYQIVHNVENYDEKNPKHQAVSEFINKEQERFIKSGRTVKGGKTFVRRERMPLVPQDQTDKYYTFSDDDIINLIALRAKETMGGQIKNTRAALEKAGYVKSGVQVAPQAQQQVQQPRKIQTPTPSKGVSVPVTPQPEQSNSILKLLDL
jgi:hypothetical protein